MDCIFRGRLRWVDLGRQTRGRDGLHRKFSPSGAVLPDELDAIYNTYVRLPIYKLEVVAKHP